MSNYTHPDTSRANRPCYGWIEDGATYNPEDFITLTPQPSKLEQKSNQKSQEKNKMKAVYEDEDEDSEEISRTTKVSFETIAILCEWRPTFHKVYNPSKHAKMMAFPQQFEDSFGNIIPEKCILKISPNSEWKIHLEKVKKRHHIRTYLSMGWEKFLLDNNIGIDTLLTFIYVGEDTFIIHLSENNGIRMKVNFPKDFTPPSNEATKKIGKSNNATTTTKKKNIVPSSQSRVPRKTSRPKYLADYV